ncbi:MAG: CatA-like O-acetyltransferase [bacterium]|nr:CatA-like O-acetyltransferase [bacterium]
MNFTPIDLQSWPRGQMFYYFSKMQPTGYSMTVRVDVTKLRKKVQDAGLKFFPVYLWLVTRNLNRQTEFKVAEKDGVLGYYDVLTPLYASFHEDDHTFSLMWTPYRENFSEFYEAYLKNQQEFGDTHGVLCQPQTLPPANAYTVSCIPWVQFEHFAIHSYENHAYYFPSVEAGKFIEQDNRIYMPLSITCHHATTDGYHVNRFLEDLQEDMNHFESLYGPSAG